MHGSGEKLDAEVPVARRTGPARTTTARRERGGESAPWARALREAREREGLTQRALARLLGVAQQTVRSAEAGHPPRHSTLMAYLAALPSLRAGDILPGRDAPPAATPAAWRRMQRILGFSAERVRLERTGTGSRPRVTVTIDGVKTVEPSMMEERATQLALMRAVCRGSNAVLQRLEPPSLGRKGLAHVLREDDCEHSFRFERSRGALVMSYGFRGAAESDDVLEQVLDFPAERLDLAWRCAGTRASAPPLCARVRPEPIAADDAAADLARRMHPADHVPLKGRDGTRWSIRFPMPGFVYSLRVDAERVAAKERGWSLASTLRTARERAGLSLRDVAEAAGTSHASFAYAEGGRDPRASTLVGYLRALPSLAPQDILPAVARLGEATDMATWTLMRDLYGYEIEEVVKTLSIGTDGRSTNVIETRGLRPLRDDLRDFRVRVGLHRAVAQASESVLLDVETDLAETRVRLVKRQEGPVVHEFRFPRSLGRGSIAYTRTYAGPVFAVPASRRAETSEAEPVISGSVLPVYHPMRRLRLRVRLPPRFIPNHVRTVAYPTCIVPTPHLSSVSRDLVAPPCTIDREANALVLTLAVSHPHVGVRYGISWGVP